MKNIWIFNHYAQSPKFPGGTRHYDFALELSKRGYSVTIFASGFHYTLLKDIVEYNDKGYFIEYIDSIRFVWVKTFPYTVNNLKRLINTFSYYWKLSSVVPLLNLEKPNIIIGSTVHPFAALIAKKFANKYKVSFIFEIRDLWPQTFIDMGIWKSNSLKSLIFSYIEKITIKNTDRIIILSPLTEKYLIDTYSFNPNHIFLIPNGVNEKFIQKVYQAKNYALKIMYVGGIDSVHGLDFIIDLAYELRNDNIIFDIYGDGKERTRLSAESKQKDITNIIWHGSISKSEVPAVLYEANLLLLSTANVLYGSENKLHEYMASAKPIIVAISGNHNNPLNNVECGLVINKENISESALKIREFILLKAQEFESMGLKGQKYILEYRTINVLVDKLESLINKL